MTNQEELEDDPLKGIDIDLLIGPRPSNTELQFLLFASLLSAGFAFGTFVGAKLTEFRGNKPQTSQKETKDEVSRHPNPTDGRGWECIRYSGKNPRGNEGE